ncbi:hypothetical protein BT69DRAFT_1348730 [Atractiella rhizophila]|nr:hypothetical protein BT69DRAFT_1348730 [Atractiella rhizophila]
MPMEYAKLKIPELKVILKERGLPVSGKKGDLVERLQRHDAGEPLKKRSADADIGVTHVAKKLKKSHTQVSSGAEEASLSRREETGVDGNLNKSLINHCGIAIAAPADGGPTSEKTLTVSQTGEQDGAVASLRQIPTATKAQIHSCGPAAIISDTPTSLSAKSASTQQSMVSPLKPRSNQPQNAPVTEPKPSAVSKASVGSTRHENGRWTFSRLAPSTKSRAAGNPPRSQVSKEGGRISTSITSSKTVAIAKTIDVTGRPLKTFVPLRPSSNRPITPKTDPPTSSVFNPSTADLVASYAWLDSFIGNIRPSSSSHRRDGVLSNIFTPSCDTSVVENLLVSLRFTLKRLYTYFSLSISNPLFQIRKAASGDDELLRSMTVKIYSARICGGGIALIELEDGTSHWVVEKTGEVIGERQLRRKEKLSDRKGRVELRGDWRTYVDQLESNTGRDLLEFVQTSDPESYPHGISKFYLSRLPIYGTVEFEVARSVVLSSSCPNSISGSFQSLVQQASHASSNPYHGLPMAKGALRRASRKTVELQGEGRHIALFLEPSMCVESVHVRTAENKPVVQVHTAGMGTLWVCKLTGTVVGNEDGVGEAYKWMFGGVSTRC